MFSLEIFVLLALTLLNGFFAMSEMAIISARRARLDAMAEAGDHGAAKAADLAREPTGFLSSVQIGLTLISIGTGAFGTATLSNDLVAPISAFEILRPHAEAIAIGVIVVITTLLTLVFGELVPKRIALAYPETIAARVARPINLLAVGARPVVALLGVSTAFILRLLRVPTVRDQSVTEEEVQTILQEGTESGVIDPQERVMVKEVIGLAERSIAAIMTRRSEVYWIDVEDDPKVVRAELRQCPFSRVVVAKDGSINEPLGYVHKKDLLDVLLEGKPLDIEKNVREPLFVPEAASVLDVLELFRTKRNHFAFVIDEFGAFEGVVTLTDVLEAIAGDIPEEHEVTRQAIVTRADGTYLVDGRAEIAELEETVGIAVPEDARFHTVAGLALELFGRIPVEGDTADMEDGWTIEVIDMDGRRIDKLLIRRAANA
ncbi:MAG TPA: hemolysin family protein [Beijerinckiaceae bacterium]|nr:hemolysin family protein [Beijerinckiaceae bacterium]